jgi:hypothetical protein
MLNPAGMLWRTTRGLWVKGLAHLRPSRRQQYFLHDPAASRPHDLDDPFFDPKAQERMAEVIAVSARKKPTSSGVS